MSRRKPNRAKSNSSPSPGLSRKAGTVTLLDLRDELAVARDFVSCSYAACSMPIIKGTGGSPVCTVLDEACQRLDRVLFALDQLVRSSRE